MSVCVCVCLCTGCMCEHGACAFILSSSSYCASIYFLALSQASLVFAFCLCSLTIIHCTGRPQKNGEGLGAFIMWMMSGGREVDIRGGEGAQLSKQCMFEHSIIYRSFGLQMLAWLKLHVLVLTSKKLAFKFSTMNIGPSIPTSTSCPLMWWMLPGLPRFSRWSHVLLWTQKKVKT